MTTKRKVNIIDREIPGLTSRQLAAFVVLIASVVGIYFNLTSQIKTIHKMGSDNNSILKEIQSDRRDADKMNNIRLTNIELDQREAKIRLTNLETQNK